MVQSALTTHQIEADHRDLRDRLGELLPDCRVETIRDLVVLARFSRVSAGEQIRRQGEPVPMTLIVGGFAISCRTTDQGQMFCGGIVPQGILFGYSGIGSVLSSLGFVALTDCVVAEWHGSEIRQLVKADVALGFAAIDSMATALHEVWESVDGFLHQEARRRVLRILARHRDLFFGEGAVLTRAHLAGLVGTSQEMTRRVLRQLEREGAIAREGRSGLRLLRPDLLESPAA